MPKNIVLFSDGTGNSSGKLFKTNVWRLYQALDLSGPDSKRPKKPEQIAYYDDGVGTSSFKPLAILGGAFGWGLKRNVIDLYTFLCRNYLKGDAIYCFGFSRGAFTIRVLVGLINSQGLVSAETQAELKRLGLKAFREYRRAHYQSVLRLESPARALRDGMIRAKNKMMGQGASPQPGIVMTPQITFLGLWDSVAAYGLPIEELTRAWNAVFPLSVPDRDLSGIVKRACHALALDDERNSFHPVLWNEDHQPEKNATSTHIRDEIISQVWFTGMHSNVGGGYPDDALAHVSLAWIMEEANSVGLQFKEEEWNRIKATVNPYGKLYDSRHGLGGTYRYLPRKLSTLTNDTDDKTNQVVIPRPKIHESVFQQIAKGVDGYAPFVLPERYAVVTASGAIVDSSVPGQSSLHIKEDPTQATNRWNCQEKIWNLVWWKRLAYFSSILVAIALVAFPLYRPSTIACEGPICALAPVVRGIGMFLPDFLGVWLDAFQSHPGTFSFLLSFLAILLAIGGRLQIRIFDEMGKIWKHIKENPGSPTTIQPLPSDALFRFRTHPLYQRFFKLMKRVILPTVIGVLATLALLEGVSQGLFSMMSSAGLVCSRTNSSQLQRNILEEGRFPTNSLCWASGILLKEGKRYRITLTIDDNDKWRDGNEILTGVGGFKWEKMTLPMYSGLLIRRHTLKPWYKPIARIGDKGSDEYPLDPSDQSIPDPETKTLVAEITARRDGELFLFVNDAVLPVPRSWQIFYNNNKGTALVTVHPLSDERS